MKNSGHTHFKVNTQMGFTYTIVHISNIDLHTQVPTPYIGLAIPLDYIPYITNDGHWSSSFASILFEGFILYSDMTTVEYILPSIRSYDDLVEELVENHFETFWTREKHERFLQAFRFFSENGLYIQYSS